MNKGEDNNGIITHESRRYKAETADISYCMVIWSKILPCILIFNAQHI